MPVHHSGQKNAGQIHAADRKKRNRERKAAQLLREALALGITPAKLREKQISEGLTFRCAGEKRRNAPPPPPQRKNWEWEYRRDDNDW